MNLLSQRVIPVIVLFVLMSNSSLSSIGPITLDELTNNSDKIVIGKVVQVFSIEGVSIAEVQVKRCLKGDSTSNIYFLNLSTWTCDITGADSGKTYLFFFGSYKFRDKPRDSGIRITSFYEEPVGFKEAVQNRIGTILYKVMDAGRGQMPLRIVSNTQFVTIWVCDIILPRHIKTIAGPDKRYSDFIRSARLKNIVTEVVSIINSRRSR